MIPRGGPEVLRSSKVPMGALLCFSIAEVTYYHVGLESWLGYPADWEYIQNNFPSMAPKNLGSMGYAGIAGMFIPRHIQRQAYSATGEALQFYRDWNATWNQPGQFFDSISADFSKLASCNMSDSVMSNDGVWRRHVTFTGDADGVIIKNDSWRQILDDVVCVVVPVTMLYKFPNLRKQ